MIKKVVSKRNINECFSPTVDLEFWLSKTPEERIAAVEYLRRQCYGSSARLQRVARVVKRARR